MAESKLFVRNYGGETTISEYYGDDNATYTIDGTNQFWTYAHLRGVFTLEVTGPDEVTLHAGSLQHNGTTYNWSQRVAHRGVPSHPYYNNISSPQVHYYYLAEATPSFLTQTYVSPSWISGNQSYSELVIPELSVLNGQAVPDDPSDDMYLSNNNMVIGLLPVPQSGGGGGEGAAAGDPFVTPMI
jgi:hypothetical protein